MELRHVPQTAVRHSLEFAFNKILFKIFDTLSKDTYRDICSYFRLCSIEDMVSTRQSRFTLKYCASDSDICRVIGCLR